MQTIIGYTLQMKHNYSKIKKKRIPKEIHRPVKQKH